MKENLKMNGNFHKKIRPGTELVSKFIQQNTGMSVKKPHTGACIQGVFGVNTLFFFKKTNT